MATFIAGPCVIESMELLETVAQELVRINEKLGSFAGRNGACGD